MNEKSVSETVAIFPSSESFFSVPARKSRSRFQILSNIVSLELAPGRRIYPRGSALPAASSAASRLTIARFLLSRDFSISGLYAATVSAPGYDLIVLIYRKMTRLRSSDANSGSGSVRLCARRVAHVPSKLERKTTC